MKAYLASTVAAALALGAVAQSASAGTILMEPTARKAVVGYADLNLARADHALIMVERLDAAAARVCRQSGRPPLSLEARLCREAAVADAVERVQAPALQAAYGVAPYGVIAGG